LLQCTRDRWIDDHVAELAGIAAIAAVGLTMDDAAADALADEDIEEIAQVAGLP
jgi:hypothetical protein